MLIILESPARSKVWGVHVVARVAAKLELVALEELVPGDEHRTYRALGAVRRKAGGSDGAG